jgi:hypothetical protein
MASRRVMAAAVSPAVLRGENGGVVEAARQPSIWARMLRSMLQTAREVAGLSHDEAAARLRREADWLVRVETGFAAASPDEVARIVVGYGVREARAADSMIDLARRVAAPPPWLAPHTSVVQQRRGRGQLESGGYRHQRSDGDERLLGVPAASGPAGVGHGRSFLIVVMSIILRVGLRFILTIRHGFAAACSVTGGRRLARF